MVAFLAFWTTTHQYPNLQAIAHGLWLNKNRLNTSIPIGQGPAPSASDWLSPSSPSS